MLRLHYKPEPLKLQGLGMNSFCQTLVLRPRQGIRARLLRVLQLVRRARREKRVEPATAVVLDRPSGEITI